MNNFQFVNVFYIYLLLPGLLFVIILGLTIYKKRIERRTKLWQESIAKLISESIFFAEGVEPEDINDKYSNLINLPAYRQSLINEILKIRKSLSGISTVNLKEVYEALHLDEDSHKKLKSSKWHIIAKGIQELAVMEQVKYGKEIFKLTNNPNELVRSEAQCALVNFYGFPGLRFLNVTVYPISQLQQMQLLNVLYLVKAENFDPVKKWLHSTNESVIAFALKLAKFYNCFEVYDDVVKCLQDPNSHIKLNALEYLKNMPREGTASQVVATYFSENKEYKLAILEALQIIGTDEVISFLEDRLQDNDNDIKAAAAKALSKLHPEGTAFLLTQSFADLNPWKKIFLQISNERAA